MYYWCLILFPHAKLTGGDIIKYELKHVCTMLNYEKHFSFVSKYIDIKLDSFLQ